MKKRKLLSILALMATGLIFSCSSSEVTNNGQSETGSFTDPRDGKVYKTVKIGDYWMMAENLAFKPETGNYWAYNNDESNVAIYGYLYDWETAMNVAPEGWHVPSRTEWMRIQRKLGAKMNTFVYLEKIYPKLIVGGSSGLEMQLGGFRTCDGKFKFMGDKARFWNGDNQKSEKSTYGLDSNKGGHPHGLWGSTAPCVFNNSYQKTCPGYSVRLIKD